jgi:hypothetical protein
MTRKRWSNTLLLVAAVNLVLGITPSNRFRILDWVLVGPSIVLAVIARRKMI